MLLRTWVAVSWAAHRARRRLLAVLAGDREAGALSLEWIVIAVLLVAAAGVAYGLFRGAIQAEAKKLP